MGNKNSRPSNKRNNIHDSENKMSAQDLVVYRFIRRIATEISLSQSKTCSILSIIPSSIYHLCCKYCENPNTDYLYLWCASSIIQNYISCINTKDIDNKLYKFDLKRYRNVDYSNFCDKKFSATVLVHNLSTSIIPSQYHEALNPHNVCALFRIGGKYVSPEEFSSKCNIILFNSPSADTYSNHIIDGYIEDLPDMNQPNSCAASIYSASQHILYIVGGLNNCNIVSNSIKQIQNEVSSLNMNDWNCNDEFKWKTHPIKLNTKRYQTCLSWIGCNIAICGGCKSWITPTKECEMIRLDHDGNQIKEIVALSPMNYERAFVQSAECESHKLVIGGGILREHSAYTVEFYDGNKNVWIEYPERTQFRHDQAIMWCDNDNRNIIYIGGHTLHSSYLGAIEWIDMRDNLHRWNTLRNRKGESELFSLFHLAGHNEQISLDYWTRRHLLI